jgi:hypothetical protein
MAARSKSPPLWFAALWLLFGAPFLIVGVRGLVVRNSLRHELASGGETVVGTVIKKEIARADAFTRTYWIDFRYLARDGQRFQSHAQLDEDIWYGLTELGPIQVRYLRAHPDRRVIAGEPDDTIMWWIFAGLGGLFSLIGVLLLAFRIRRALRRPGGGLRKSPPPTASSAR